MVGHSTTYGRPQHYFSAHRKPCARMLTRRMREPDRCIAIFFLAIVFFRSSRCDLFADAQARPATLALYIALDERPHHYLWPTAALVTADRTTTYGRPQHYLWPTTALVTADCGTTCTLATCAMWPPVQYGYLRTMATCAIWPPVPYGHLCNMATCVIWPPVQYGHHRMSITHARKWIYICDDR